MLQQFDSYEFKALGSAAMLEARVGDKRMVFISSWAPHGEMGIEEYADLWSVLGAELDRTIGWIVFVGMDANSVVPYWEETSRYVG
eukprot:3974881-Heterocapsa_arctica.AAC.1